VVVVATVLGQLGAALAGVLPAHWAAVGATVVAAAYALGRSFVKAGGAESLTQLALASETAAAVPVAPVAPAPVAPVLVAPVLPAA
jgi:hypothetical protein